MNVERLENAIRVAREIPMHDLFISCWVPVECSTACCFAGHMMRDPWFAAEGLLERDGQPSYRPPNKRWHNGYVALSLFFDLSIGDTMMLFSPDAYEEVERSRYKTEFIDRATVLLRDR